MLVEKYGWANQKSLFAETNQDSTFSHTRENSKMFNITSKYFSFFLVILLPSTSKRTFKKPTQITVNSSPKKLEIFGYRNV